MGKKLLVSIIAIVFFLFILSIVFSRDLNINPKIVTKEITKTVEVNSAREQVASCAVINSSYGNNQLWECFSTK